MALSNLKTKYMTRNDCYVAGRKITPRGIMVHSTATPGVMAASWFSRWNKSHKAREINRQVCVHAFLDDKEIWQYLPWNHRGWHAGGKANDTHIGFEICEPGGFSYSKNKMVGYDVKKNEAYFRAAWKNAVNLCVLLCREYGLSEKDIISHAEGNKKGIASNHADVGHWFPKHGENMDTFRAAVKNALENADESREDFQAGDIVEIKASARTYYPGGPIILNWVKWNYHLITQDVFNGKPVIKGGKECVLLGKTILKSTMDEKPGIMTWIDKDNLEMVSAGVEVEPEKKSGEKYYRVQVGAFSEKKNQKDRMVKTTVNETLVGSLEKKREDRQVEQQKEEDRLAKDIENLQKSLDETSLTIEDLKEIDDPKTKNFELDKLKDEKREQVDTLNLKRINLTSKVENLNQNLKDKKDSLEAYSVKGDEETGKEWEATLHQLEEKGLKFQDKNQEIMDRYQVSSLEELVNVKYRYENFVARKESLNNDIDRVEQTLRDLEKANQATKTELIKKVSSFEPVDDLMLIPEKMNQLKELRQSLQDKRLALNFKIGELSEGEKSLTIEDITKEVRTIEGELQKEEMQVNDEIQEFQEEQFVEIKEEVGQLQEKMYSLGNTITKEESTLKEKYREKKNVSQIENEISALKNQLEGLRNEYEALVLAREVLDEAFIEIQRSFGPRLNETTAKIFSKLTNGKYQKLQVNREFDIIVEDEKEQSLREWKFLSAGTMDQAYLALRLSVATLLKADKENLPLFLDDIFMQYDDVRAYEALSFLQEYQKDSESNQQIILFTCHKRIMTWAKQDFPEIRLQQVI